MASVNYEKQKSAQEAKAKMKHDATDERLKNDHQNEHIDKSKTHLNKSPDYAEMCELYDNRINELDATTNTNKRKDRVTLISLEIPVPEHLEREKYDAWFDDVEKCVKDRYGDDNVLFRADHYDEEHEYFDPAKEKMVMSRVHTRFCVVPEKDGGLNAKWATKRSNMIQINNEIHEMTAEKYNCEFMDGTKRKSDKSVTALKNASRKAELDAREIALNKVKDQFYKQVEAVKADLSVQEDDLKLQRNKIQKREESVSNQEYDAKIAMSDVEQKQLDLDLQLEQSRNSQIKADREREALEKLRKKAEKYDAIVSSFVETLPAPPKDFIEFSKGYTKKVKRREVVTNMRGDKVQSLVKDKAGNVIEDVLDCSTEYIEYMKKVEKFQQEKQAKYERNKQLFDDANLKVEKEYDDLEL